MNPRKTIQQINVDEVNRLVVASQGGDADAFGKLYDIFVDQIYRYIYYRVGAEEAEDLTELVFLKTWENMKKYYANGGTFSSWIFRIAHNVVVDYYRSQNGDGKLSENIKDHRIESYTQHRAHRHFDQTLLQEAMKELKGHYRQIIILKYVNELSYEEIETIMNRSQAALRILQFRALKSLRRILENKGISSKDV